MGLPRNKVSKTVYVTLEQEETLRKLSEITRVPQSEYIREGIEIALKKYRHVIESGKKAEEE